MQIFYFLVYSAALKFPFSFYFPSAVALCFSAPSRSCAGGEWLSPQQTDEKAALAAHHRLSLTACQVSRGRAVLAGSRSARCRRGGALPPARPPLPPRPRPSAMADAEDGDEPGAPHSHPGSAGSKAGAPDKMFSLKKWNAVAMWSWDVECDTCAICRVQVMGKHRPTGPGRHGRVPPAGQGAPAPQQRGAAGRTAPHSRALPAHGGRRRETRFPAGGGRPPRLLFLGRARS